MKSSSKNYYIRPAGESDDDESDSDGFSFADDDSYEKKRYCKPAKLESAENKRVYTCEQNLLDPNEEKRDLEFRVMNACLTGHTDILEEYVNCGHDVNTFLHSGWTPLLYAAFSIQPEIIKQLLQYGADPNIHKDGYTPLMALCNSPNMDTCKRNSLECIKLLIEAKADVNSINQHRETALMFACKSRDITVVEELLKYCNDINAMDYEGQTALFYAVLGNRVDIVKLLLQNKAISKIKNRHDMTPHDIALTKEYGEIAALLEVDSDGERVYCEIARIVKWQDMFPDLCNVDNNMLNPDVATILSGMGLERYKLLFRGMDLKTFLRLDEEDLVKLGIDMSVHRNRFLEDIYKFHSRKWTPQSLGFSKKKIPYTIFDAVLSLGNILKQFSIIGSSFYLIRQGIKKYRNENIVLNPEQKFQYKKEIENTQDTLVSLEKELCRVKAFAQQIEKENRNSYPATFIGKEKQSFQWPIVLGITVIIGIFVSKTVYVQRIWNH